MNNFIKINHTEKDIIFTVRPMHVKRKWMTDTQHGFAYSCLPLNIANQYGWEVLSPTDFSVEWNGGTAIKDLTVTRDSRYSSRIKSNFGNGILTIIPDFIIKTNEEVSLIVRGIPNSFKENIMPMDGIVETDWLNYTFTMNFKLIKPGTISFEKDEPLFCFYPIKRGFIESFDIVSTSMFNDSKLSSEYSQYNDSRSSFIYSQQEGFQRFYINGLDSKGEKVEAKNRNKTIKIDNPREEL